MVDSTRQLRGRPVLSRRRAEPARRSGHASSTHGAAGDRGRRRGSSPRRLAAPGAAGRWSSAPRSAGSRRGAERASSTLLLIGGPIALLLASLGRATASPRPRCGRSRRCVAARRRSPPRSPTSVCRCPPAQDEISRLGETLNEMLDRLEAALEHERRFVDDASHELRTPLALHKTELELALRYATGEEELRAAIASAVEEIDRLIQLAEDLLVVARSEEGRARASSSSACQSASCSRRWASASRPRRRVRPAPGRRGRRRARRRGRSPAPRAGADQHGRQRPALRGGRGPALGEPSTTAGWSSTSATPGPGFPPDFVARAFERFSRADARPRPAAAAGLGLAIVETIATRARGRGAGGAIAPTVGPTSGSRFVGEPRSESSAPLYHRFTAVSHHLRRTVSVNCTRR